MSEYTCYFCFSSPCLCGAGRNADDMGMPPPQRLTDAMSDEPKRQLLPGEAEADAWIDTLERRADAMSDDSRVYFMCQSCEEHNPEGAVSPRSDIAVMPDGTWLCGGCYSDCDKSAYSMVASEGDFEFPHFKDLPRPAAYKTQS